MQRIIEFEPGFDKRNIDPNKNYGIHGMNIRFVLKGKKGAIQFLLMTDWYLPHVQKEYFYKFPKDKYFSLRPMGADVGYHSLLPQYDGQTVIEDSCKYLDGVPCYYDGSGLAGEELATKFLTDGVDVVWKKLEENYVYRFGEFDHD